MISRADESTSGPGPDGQASHEASTTVPRGGVERLVEAFTTDLTGIFTDAGLLLRISRRRRQLALRRWLERSARALLLMVAGVTLIIAGALRLVSGLSEGLAEGFGGRAWLGNLLGGALALGLVAACVAWAHFARARREFQKRRSEYGDLEVDESDPERAGREADETASDRGGTARATRGTGLAEDLDGL